MVSRNVGLNAIANVKTKEEKTMMMTFDEFKKALVNDITRVLGRKIVVKEVNKINIKKTSIILCCEPMGVSPCIYIEDLYNDYKRMPVECEYLKIMYQACFTLEGNTKDGITDSTNLNDIIDINYIMENVYMCFINTDKNREFLKDVPHKEFFDLSIYFRVKVAKENDYITSYVVKNQLINKLGITEEELYKKAYNNTPKLFEPISFGINELMFGQKTKPKYNLFYILTNKEKNNGSINILYHENLKKVADLYESDLYIIPSSIHEVILMPVGCNVDDIHDMCKAVNNEEVREEEVLGDTIYKYERETGYIMPA